MALCRSITGARARTSTRGGVTTGNRRGATTTFIAMATAATTVATIAALTTDAATTATALLQATTTCHRDTTAPHRDRAMTATVGLLVLGMIALMVMCVVPPESRFWPLMVGVPAVLGSRILLEVRARKLKQAFEG